jgi:hypothetical protein
MALETGTMKKIIGLMMVVAMAGTGCSNSSNPVADNSVAAQLARSLPAGRVSAPGSPEATQAIQQAQGINNNSSVAGILNGLAAMNQVATEKNSHPGVPSNLTVGDLITAFNKGMGQNNPANPASASSHQRIGYQQGVIGPGTFMGPTANGQNLKAQMVPALTTPY